MMIARIKPVATGIEQPAQLYGLIGLIGMHRPAIQLVRTQPNRGKSDEREWQPAK
jgi:hypothetical protein